MPSSRLFIVAALIMAVGIALAGWLAGRGLVESRLGHRTVVVKGFSERIVKADIGFLPIRFVASGPDLAIARERLETAERAVFQYLEDKGFGSDAREVQNIRVEDRITSYNSASLPSESRFVLSEDVIVRSSDVAKLEATGRDIGNLVRSGVMLTSDQYNSGPVFLFTQLNDLKPEMLTEATKRARQAAEQFAREIRLSRRRDLQRQSGTVYDWTRARDPWRAFGTANREKGSGGDHHHLFPHRLRSVS